MQRPGVGAGIDGPGDGERQARQGRSRITIPGHSTTSTSIGRKDVGVASPYGVSYAPTASLRKRICLTVSAGTIAFTRVRAAVKAAASVGWPITQPKIVTRVRVHLHRRREQEVGAQVEARAGLDADDPALAQHGIDVVDRAGDGHVRRGQADDLREHRHAASQPCPAPSGRWACSSVRRRRRPGRRTSYS